MSPTSGPWTGASCQIRGGIRLEIKYTISVMCLNYPETIPSYPSPWKNCLSQNRSLVLKWFGTAAVQGFKVHGWTQASSWRQQQGMGWWSKILGNLEANYRAVQTRTLRAHHWGLLLMLFLYILGCWYGFYKRKGHLERVCLPEFILKDTGLSDMVT